MQANYYGYQKMKKEYPDSPMGGYTRLIHCDEPDSLMHLIPSFRVNALSMEYMRWYTPMQRSWAFVQWLMRYPVREQYILSIDPDTLFMVPPPLLATPDTIFALPYNYINCMKPELKPLCEDPRFNPNGVTAEEVPPVRPRECDQYTRERYHNSNVGQLQHMSHESQHRRIPAESPAATSVDARHCLHAHAGVMAAELRPVVGASARAAVPCAVPGPWLTAPLGRAITCKSFVSMIAYASPNQADAPVLCSSTCAALAPRPGSTCALGPRAPPWLPRRASAHL